MPTTNSPKGSAIPVRPTPQMRQQLDELIAPAMRHRRHGSNGNN
jgi:hypothetical protein